ncbi:MAG TPA: Rcas_1661 family thioredoxin-like (seleno)lipoprotein [Chloroflexota bacterium]|nr:Rcas_1661 family thioredoxin-like (seleno)lipoprotein [Chloroflexota bacterium]
MLSLRRRLSFALAATLLALTLAVPSHADEVVEEAPPDPMSFEVPASEPLQPPILPEPTAIAALLAPPAPPETLVSQVPPPEPTSTVIPTATPSYALYKGIPTGLTADGFPFLGAPNAPVTLIDYSDFVCPNCQRHARFVEPVIVDRYVKPGHVRLVFRDVLNHGEHSLRAAEAGACAARQDHFWQMHELLFERMREVSDATEAGLPDLMKHLGGHLRTMDQGKFWRCLDDRATVSAIRAADTEQRRRGITSQPVFEIGQRRIFGNQSFELFQSALDTALRAAR